MTRLIVVFGREPIPGRVKTRLASAVGEDRAAEIYTRLLEHTLTEATATGIGVVLSLAQAQTGQWKPPPGLQIEVQSEGDLGRRMGQSFRRHFTMDADQVLLIGSDCPGVTRDHLLKALEMLSSAPVVLGPAEDGGYWAIAQQAPGVDCFSGVPWSSDKTLEITRERLRMLGVEWAEIETLEDVDTVDDLGLLDQMAKV
jgi:rSAM/selenodomain-associated transferase 1